MIVDAAHYRLSKPPRVTDDIPSETCTQLLKLRFTKNRVDADNINNILCHEEGSVLYSSLFQFKFYILYFLEIYIHYCTNFSKII